MRRDENLGACPFQSDLSIDTTFSQINLAGQFLKAQCCTLLQNFICQYFCPIAPSLCFYIFFRNAIPSFISHPPPGVTRGWGSGGPLGGCSCRVLHLQVLCMCQVVIAAHNQMARLGTAQGFPSSSLEAYVTELGQDQYHVLQAGRLSCLLVKSRTGFPAGIRPSAKNF
jgi:hypothetical protein